ncbi:hypothetical protein PHJA_002116600 [Phtheirospermum japonicum]|uniref:Uncharacterized protein n=1 Tax=Phtheirospermum japonicum TaxID=374723 RepID=A0A830CXC6_9LAMI|nr:hypothetical protein PHJA_002116600 [Phtheirospermum japonicum]
MDDNQRRSPASSSSSSSAAAGKQCRRRLRRHAEDEDGGDPTVACTGKSCQSCTAGVIADCVAVCCCPCAVVNILTLAFVKLPWAVARRCLGGRRKVAAGGDWRRGGNAAAMGTGMGFREREGQKREFRRILWAEDVWLELYEVGHLGFGRVSFTGIPYQDRVN